MFTSYRVFQHELIQYHTKHKHISELRYFRHENPLFGYLAFPGMAGHTRSYVKLHSRDFFVTLYVAFTLYLRIGCSIK
jgi:hypothetical protein